MKIVDDILEKIKIARLQGESSVIAIFPQSISPWALKELNDVYNIHGIYKGHDNLSHAEPHIIYEIMI